MNRYIFSSLIFERNACIHDYFNLYFEIAFEMIIFDIFDHHLQPLDTNEVNFVEESEKEIRSNDRAHVKTRQIT